MAQTTRQHESQPTPPPVERTLDWWRDERGVRYVAGDVPHLTTWGLAKELDMYHETVYRWAKKWFGPLPEGRPATSNAGYRIPVEYRLVARLWLQTEDHRIREVGRRAIVTDPKNWLVVVDNIGSTHYSGGEAGERVLQLLREPTFKGRIISTVFVGDPTER